MNQGTLVELLKSAAVRSKAGDRTGALAVYNKIIEQDENCMEAYFNIGNILHMNGEIGKAIKSFQKVLELDPQNTDAAISLSVLLNDIGKYEEAKIIFDKANRDVKSRPRINEDVHLNRKFSLRHYELAEMYYSYNRFDESLFEYNKAIGLDPTNLEIRIKIAKTYMKKGFSSKAFEELKKLKMENPAYLPAKMALGLLYFEKGDVLGARTQWQNVLSKDPAHQEAKMYLELSNSAKETIL